MDRVHGKAIPPSIEMEREVARNSIWLLLLVLVALLVASICGLLPSNTLSPLHKKEMSGVWALPDKYCGNNYRLLLTREPGTQGRVCIPIDKIQEAMQVMREARDNFATSNCDTSKQGNVTPDFEFVGKGSIRHRELVGFFCVTPTLAALHKIEGLTFEQAESDELPPQ